MKDKTIRRILLFFAIISAVLAGVAITAMRNMSRATASSDWVNHTHATILAVDGVLGAVHAADARLRTYVMSGDARDASACKEALALIAENLEVAKALTRHEPQHTRIEQLEELANGRMAFARKVLTLRQSNDAAGVQAALAEEGGATAKPIERLVGSLKEEEMALLAERDTLSFRQAQTTRWTVWTGVAVDLVLLIGVAWVIRDDLAARHRLASTLQETNQQLDAKVRERTRELASANDRLSAENLERRWSNQALEHQLRYNELIINSINDSVLVLTKAMNVSRVNPAAVQLTGREPSDLINQPLGGLVRWPKGQTDSGMPLADLMARALRDGRDLRDQPAELIGAGGLFTRVGLTLFPLRDRDKVVGGVVVLQPVSTPVQQSA